MHFTYGIAKANATKFKRLIDYCNQVLLNCFYHLIDHCVLLTRIKTYHLVTSFRFNSKCRFFDVVLCLYVYYHILIHFAHFLWITPIDWSYALLRNKLNALMSMWGNFWKCVLRNFILFLFPLNMRHLYITIDNIVCYTKIFRLHFQLLAEMSKGSEKFFCIKTNLFYYYARFECILCFWM